MKVLTFKHSIDDLSQRELLKFYLPMVLNSGVVTISTPVINLALAFSPYKKDTLAAYAAAFGVMIVLNALAFAGEMITTSLLGNKKEFTSLRSFLYLIGIILFCLHILIGATPIGEYIFFDLFGASKHIGYNAQDFILVISLMPIFVARRSLYQGLAMIYKRANVLATSTTIRLVIAVVITLFGVHLFPELMAISAGVGLTLGVFFENIYLYHHLKDVKDFAEVNINTARANENGFTFKFLLKYSIPLWGGRLAWTMSFILISYFIGKTFDPDLGLASFGVLRSLFIFSTAAVYPIGSLVQIYGKTKEHVSMIFSFSLLCVFLLFLIFMLSYFSNLHVYLLKNIFGLTGDLLQACLAPIVLFAVNIPLLAYYRFLEGYLLRHRRSQDLGIISVIRILTVIIVGEFLLIYNPSMVGGKLGMIIMVAASFMECVVGAYYLLTHYKKQTL